MAPEKHTVSAQKGVIPACGDSISPPKKRQSPLSPPPCREFVDGCNTEFIRESSVRCRSLSKVSIDLRFGQVGLPPDSICAFKNSLCALIFGLCALNLAPFPLLMAPPRSATGFGMLSKAPVTAHFRKSCVLFTYYATRTELS